MRVSGRSRTSLFVDALIVMIGATAICGSAYYFSHDDGLGRVSFKKVKHVGRFATARNDVRRRIHSGLTWSSVSSNDRVFDGDSIFTGDSSTASIELENGARLEVDPKSLVMIRVRDPELHLDLQYGSLIGRVDSRVPIFFLQGGHAQEITGPSAEIRIENEGRGGDSRIHVIKGQVRIRKVAADPATRASTRKAPASALEESQERPRWLNENEIALFKDQAPPVVQKESFQLLSPPDGSSMWAGLGQRVQLKWKSSAKDHRIEIATDPTFVKPTFKSPAAFEYTLTAEQLPSGTFYWRIVPETPGRRSEPSRPARLTVYPDVPPQPLFPTDRQEFAYDAQSAETGKQVLLSWEDKSGSEKFDLELAADETFSKPIFLKQLTATNEKSPKLAEGSYFWRVRGLHPQRAKAPWSSTMRFSVTEAAKQPDAPRLTRQLIDYEIPLSVLEQAPPGTAYGGRGLAAENMTPFEWQADANAEGFEVELASNPDFRNSIKFENGKETKFAPREIMPSALFVRVRAKGKKGLASPPSEIGRLEVRLPAPKLEPIPSVTTKFATEDELQRGRQVFAIKWSKMPFASSYELNWGADRDFTTSRKFRTKDGFRSVTVTKPGKYSARVRAIGPDGEALSPYSEARDVEYSKELTAAPVKIAKSVKRSSDSPKTSTTRKPSAVRMAPEILEPKPATSFVSIDDANPLINLKWRKSVGAEKYEIEFAEDADFSKPIDKFETTETVYTVKSNLPEGRLFWRVRALGETSASEWSKTFDLIVLYQ